MHNISIYLFIFGWNLQTFNLSIQPNLTKYWHSITFLFQGLRTTSNDTYFSYQDKLHLLLVPYNKNSTTIDLCTKCTCLCETFWLLPISWFLWPMCQMFALLWTPNNLHFPLHLKRGITDNQKGKGSHMVSF